MDAYKYKRTKNIFVEGFNNFFKVFTNKILAKLKSLLKLLLLKPEMIQHFIVFLAPAKPFYFFVVVKSKTL